MLMGLLSDLQKLLCLYTNGKYGAMIDKEVHCEEMNRDGKAGLEKTNLKIKNKTSVKNRTKHAAIFPASSIRNPGQTLSL